MNLSSLSEEYTVRKLEHGDIDRIFLLCNGNPLFYRYCPPAVTRESIAEDMRALPPGKTAQDKFYFGFWRESDLIAVMDLILSYPNRETAFIGFFMVEQREQKRGIGTGIVSYICQRLKEEGFSFVRLGYAKGNPQSRAFWLKNGFRETGVVCENPGYTVIVLEKEL